jgi:hypothetical protein
MAAMVPFFSTSFYTGPVANALGGADISFAVGLLVAGLLYFALTRGIDLEAEKVAVAASDRELEHREPQAGHDPSVSSVTAI